VALKSLAKISKIPKPTIAATKIPIILFRVNHLELLLKLLDIMRVPTTHPKNQRIKNDLHYTSNNGYYTK
jgi:hypothetical protein